MPALCNKCWYLQTARKIHVAKFRAQKVHLLITTDVAARGIDIPLIDNIVNLDFPPKPELFVHRVGRAARCVCVRACVHACVHACVCARARTCVYVHAQNL